MARTAPSASQSRAFSALPTVAMTFAPSAAPIWIAVVPMPLAPPCTSSHSPAFKRAALEHVVPDGEHGLGQRCGLGERQTLRHRQSYAFRRRRELGIAAAIDERADKSPGLNRFTPSPSATTLPATSSPSRSEAPFGGG